MSFAKKPMGWTVRDSRLIYDNPWISLTEHDVTDPGGKDANYGKVHMKNRAVGVVPYSDGDIWMVGQSRFVLGEYSWEIPEGGCPRGEEMRAAAARELKEETGITATTMTPLLQMHLSNSVTDEWAEVFLAEGLSFGETALESSEDITVQKVTLEAAYQGVETGQITDAITVAALYKMMLLKAQGRLS